MGDRTHELVRTNQVQAHHRMRVSGETAPTTALVRGTRGASHLGCQRSCWANPFTVKQHGLQGAIEKFEEMLKNTPALLQRLGELTNKVLLCHCETDAPCHGDESSYALGRGSS